MPFNKADVIANAQSYGPKGPSKIVLYVNENKPKEINEESFSEFLGRFRYTRTRSFDELCKYCSQG